jgi:hypothetical protein
VRKKFLIVVAALALTLFFVAGGLLVYTNTYPRVAAAPELRLERTPERLARGKYLVRHVALCLDCHSQRNWSLAAGPVISGTEGMGGEVFDKGLGIPGVLYARNITPAGIGRWTDGELIRTMITGAIGEGKKAHALFPLMPYLAYGEMAEEDVFAIAAYIRTLPAIENRVPERKLNFPMNFIVRTIPRSPRLLKVGPKLAEGVKYGEYMTKVAACIECHSQRDHGRLVSGLEFAGGVEYRLPGESWVVRSANITPDPETGIGNWKRDDFIRRFKAPSLAGFTPVPIKRGDFNTIMPWTAYAGMTEQDLGAIYDFLMTLKPVSLRVEKFERK